MKRLLSAFLALIMLVLFVCGCDRSNTAEKPNGFDYTTDFQYYYSNIYRARDVREIPLIREMSRSDKRIAVFAGKADPYDERVSLTNSHLILKIENSSRTWHAMSLRNL